MTDDLFLLVVIPCLNEEKTVGRVAAAVPTSISGIGRVAVLVIDDGSTDATSDQARHAGAEVIRNPENIGLGSTFRAGVKAALSKGADIMVHIDGDGQFDPADIPRLIQPVVDGRAHMVTASRFLDAEPVAGMPAIKRWGNRGIAWIVRLLTHREFRDVSCGFRAFSKEALLSMNLFGSFTYTQETLLDLVFKNLEVLEVPVTVRGTREFGDSRVAANLPRYAVRSLQIMLRAFISYRPFSFFFAISCVFFAIGFGFLTFLGLHYLDVGAFSPHIWSGFVGGSFIFFGISTLITGLIGDMLVRVRMNQENILYLLKEADRSRMNTANQEMQD